MEINCTLSEERDASDAVQNDEGIVKAPIPEEFCAADGASQPSESVQVVFIRSLSIQTPAVRQGRTRSAGSSPVDLSPFQRPPTKSSSLEGRVTVPKIEVDLLLPEEGDGSIAAITPRQIVHSFIPQQAPSILSVQINGKELECSLAGVPSERCQRIYLKQLFLTLCRTGAFSAIKDEEVESLLSLFFEAAACLPSEKIPKRIRKELSRFNPVLEVLKCCTNECWNYAHRQLYIRYPGICDETWGIREEGRAQLRIDCRTDGSFTVAQSRKCVIYEKHPASFSYPRCRSANGEVGGLQLEWALSRSSPGKGYTGKLRMVNSWVHSALSDEQKKKLMGIYEGQ